MLRSHSQAGLRGGGGKPGRPPWRPPLRAKPLQPGTHRTRPWPGGSSESTWLRSGASCGHGHGRAAQEARSLPQTCIFMTPKGPRGGDVAWGG